MKPRTSGRADSPARTRQLTPQACRRDISTVRELRSGGHRRLSVGTQNATFVLGLGLVAGALAGAPAQAASAASAASAAVRPVAQTAARPAALGAGMSRATSLVSFASLQASLQARSATSAARARAVLSEAQKHTGKSYRFGASGPGSFDCSGFTSWVYARAGKHLPRTSSQQAAATRNIPASDRQPGDLVFFASGGDVYHVGIYAGKNLIWHAPRPGSSVHLERIWTPAHFYGRL